MEFALSLYLDIFLHFLERKVMGVAFVGKLLVIILYYNVKLEISAIL
jgi:hypothetical protein